MSLTVLDSGFLSMVQDYGRFGWQKYGITAGGPMDEHAFLWANKLLGNDFNAAQIEICMGRFSARFEQEAMIAVCGAPGNVTLNGQAMAMWRTYAVVAGDEVRMQGFSQGLYAYLAVKEGFQVEPHLHSVATVTRDRIGGLSHDGRALLDGDCLVYSRHAKERTTAIPHEFLPSNERYGGELCVRFAPNRFSRGHDELITQFTQQMFTVSAEINRMGFRLQGEAIKSLLTENQSAISQGVSLGTIQLPPDGQPIVLMKDRQTIGGYPQIGCVAYTDLAKLSQRVPGSQLRFEAVEVALLEQDLQEYLEFFQVDLMAKA